MSRNVRNRFQLRKFYGRQWDLLKQYEVSSSECCVSLYAVTTSIDQILQQLLALLPSSALLSNLAIYPIARSFHKTFAKVWLVNRGCLLLRTPVPVPFLRLACRLMLRPISPKTCLVSGTLTLEYPLVLLMTIIIMTFVK